MIQIAWELTFTQSGDLGLFKYKICSSTALATLGLRMQFKIYIKKLINMLVFNYKIFLMTRRSLQKNIFRLKFSLAYHNAFGRLVALGNTPIPNPNQEVPPKAGVNLEFSSASILPRFWLWQFAATRIALPVTLRSDIKVELAKLTTHSNHWQGSDDMASCCR